MKIKLKKGEHLEPTNNLHGLSLDEFYKLNAGKEIEVTEVPKTLKGKLTIKGKQNGN
jgi:hypothetical protein